jgi:hypothetical protein
VYTIIARVLEATHSRQNELGKKLRDAAGSFMVHLLGKLLSPIHCSPDEDNEDHGSR